MFGLKLRPHWRNVTAAKTLWLGTWNVFRRANVKGFLRMKQFYIVAFGLTLFAAYACRHNANEPRPAFYHWQTRLSLGREERDLLSEMKISRLYVRFFDVDWDESYGGPAPLAELKIDTAGLNGMEIVPCIFITNRCMEKLPAEGTSELAQRIWQKTETLALQYPGLQFSEFQSDCDWTAGTRERYFSLLKELHKILRAKNIALSATVRLHQFSSPETTGVPPADRGMLMCYNTGDLEDWAEENSILRAEEADLYFKNAPRYPLPLDGVLPVFSWGVLFRNDRMIRLIHDLQPEQLADTTRFVPVAPHRYEVVKSTWLEGHYLYAGDRLRMETPDSEDIRQCARRLKQAMQRSSGQSVLAFYHLDAGAVRNFKELKPNALMQE